MANSWNPANGVMKVQFASSRAHTNYGWGGKFYTGFVDGLTGYDVNENQPDCVTSPNIHAQNASMVAGSAFAIAYKSDINSVGLEDMVVFSVNQHAPWITVDYEYEVPDLPACPEGGCICAWSWIPNGCGEANMFLNAYRCKGAKQLLVWHQADGIDNINVDNRKQANGEWASPGFNDKCGFKHGAQTDIFSDSQISYTPMTTRRRPGLVFRHLRCHGQPLLEEPRHFDWEEPASTSTWEEPASSSVSSEESSTWSSSSAASSATGQCRSRASRRSLKRDLARAAAERKAREDPSIPERRAINAHARSQRRAAHGL
ncbi:hypothetical protein BD626DRAFT_574977 [Schizophyllum amplum]|uniref:Uncharacterized protein n=1 Tax=Schizophyllum amplum TaxID=97359 RepID=A0A550BWV6_9AGAR|nr:hypothetical protein BD626DRAFT_574977 [Auriculariopsis ampla]